MNAAWPEKNERPYEKLLMYGAKHLSDVELLTIFIKCGTSNKSALAIAQDLLLEFGSLYAILHAPQTALTSKVGIGPVKYLNLQAAFELGKRCLQHRLKPGEKINTIDKAAQLLSLKLGEQLNEVFACLFLKNNLELISYDEIFYGTVHETNVYPREIVRRALHYNAVKIILAHNHPSGNLEPSQADHSATLSLVKALLLIDVEIVDHIIVGPGTFFSFKKEGKL